MNVGYVSSLKMCGVQISPKWDYEKSYMRLNGWFWINFKCVCY